MVHPNVCPEHSGILTWLKIGGFVAGLFALVLISLSSAGYIGLNEYKISHSVTTGDMNNNMTKIAGSVKILDVGVTGKLDALSADMVDVKTSNQNTMEAVRDTRVAVRDLIRSLETQGILAKQPQDSTILLVRDFSYE